MSEMSPFYLPPKLDFVFKRLFGDPDHIEHLVRFLQAALTLPKKDFVAVRERGSDMAGIVARLAELSADEEMRMLAEAREKAERDRLARDRHIREESLAQGMEKGMEKGVEKGQAEIVRRMLRANMALSDIAGLAGWSEAEIEAMAARDNSRT